MCSSGWWSDVKWKWYRNRKQERSGERSSSLIVSLLFCHHNPSFIHWYIFTRAQETDTSPTWNHILLAYYDYNKPCPHQHHMSVLITRSESCKKSSISRFSLFLTSRTIHFYHYIIMNNNKISTSSILNTASISEVMRTANFTQL